jgi:hypothetical protein
MPYKVNCLICGAELKYETQPSKMRCYLCQDEYESNAECLNGHFVCDKCHSLQASEIISHFCINSESQDPLEMAVRLMKSPKINMHGPEHHFLVPAVLLSAYYNFKNDPAMKEEKIKLAQKRAANVLGGFCGFYGDCGSAVGTGIFISLITGANPLSKQEWTLSNLMTAKSLLSVASIGGPRCCKRTSFLSIIEACDFLAEHFGVVLPVNKDLKCKFSPLNKECLKSDCPFYAGL